MTLNEEIVQDLGWKNFKGKPSFRIPLIITTIIFIIGGISLILKYYLAGGILIASALICGLIKWFLFKEDIEEEVKEQ